MPETLQDPRPEASTQVLENPLDGTGQLPPDGAPGEIPGQMAFDDVLEHPAEAAPVAIEGDGQQEQSELSRQDEAARFTDVELLGKSFRVRRAVQESGTQTIKAWQGMVAKVRNTLAQPGKAVRQFALNRATNSFNRKQDRLNAAKSLPLRSRIQGKVNKAKERMDRREGSLNQHVGQMEARTRAVTEHADQRRREYINELRSRKEDALARKAVRSRLRREGATRRETRSILAEIPAAQMWHVGNVALHVEASRRALNKANSAQTKATRRQERADNRVTATEGQIETFDQSIKQADDAAVELSTMVLPMARGRVENLQDKLDGLEADSPDRGDIEAALTQAKADVAAYDEQLQYWRTTAKNIRARSSKADTRLGGLYDRQEARGADVTAADEAVTTGRKSNLAHRAQLKQSIDAALNNGSETGKDK